METKHLARCIVLSSPSQKDSKSASLGCTNARRAKSTIDSLSRPNQLLARAGSIFYWYGNDGILQGVHLSASSTSPVLDCAHEPSCGAPLPRSALLDQALLDQAAAGRARHHVRSVAKGIRISDGRTRHCEEREGFRRRRVLGGGGWG